jgi:hypothetical protein
MIHFALDTSVLARSIKMRETATFRRRSKPREKPPEAGDKSTLCLCMLRFVHAYEHYAQSVSSIISDLTDYQIHEQSDFVHKYSRSSVVQ